MSRRTVLITAVPAAVVAVVVLAGLAIWAGLPPRVPKPSPSPTPNTALHAFPALEARLPNDVAGHVLEKVSLPSDPELQDAKTLEVLRRLNKLPSDLQLARASLSGVDLTVAALRIVGASAIQAAVEFETVDEADPNGGSTYEPAVVAGKRVLIRTNGITVAYIYPLDDVMFVVSGNRTLVEEALGKIR